MTAEDEPALKRTADAASDAAQRTFMRLTTAQLLLLSTTVFVSGWNPDGAAAQRTVAIAVFVLMVGALAIGLALKLGRFDDKWFRLRAVAENVKSSMWRFVMSPASGATVARQSFLDEARDIQERFTGLTTDLARHRRPGDDVTAWMRVAHHLPIEAKVDLYRQHRVADQIAWYQSKAAYNAIRETRWQWTVFILEFVAILYAALQAWQLWSFNLVAGLAAVSTAFVGWSQAKRHSDLANSYGVAADDLRRISTSSSAVLSESEAEVFVREIETAISREHRMWLDRRTL